MLRNGLTPAEEELWRILRGRELEGRKFRRQHSIENYIVDFYCASEKLVIEVDGAVHDSPEAIANDSLRDEMLRHWGLKVLRIRNDEVFESLAAVRNKIISQFTNSPSCFWEGARGR
ncbi:endonuclease domain-containing protein [Pontibacter aydingkolensis]|uniref:Endonuclease domain-containing protein n=1 Tax=Pontibacter aydingkolensis TaxID=1911536 RepID=A0ABS7CNP7_9BACT|nr:endonuclease domain-containing protein [Pontibacter aydingkolensis]MBW7465454.1 endonuclease domain-containing protein [Pontibacter aydingkolensis]